MDTFGELASERHTGAGSVLYDVAYTRDKLGRITQRIETVNGVAATYGYIYDAAGRLVQVTKNGSVISAYAYDQNGNRLGRTDSIGTTAGTYDAQDRLLTYGANSYSYSANGELQSQTNPQGTTSYTYDVLGNLTSVILPDGTLIEYVIDGSNRRVGKKVNGTLVQGWLYTNQLNPIAELDGAGNVVSTFVYGTKGNVPDYMVKNGTTYRIISNHLGTPVLVVDPATGTVAQQITYDEFGNITADTNPSFIPFGFAGGLYDHQTKLTRFGARDYDAETGRWTAKDPIRFAGGDTNLYGYVLNDPVNWIDLNGMWEMPNITIGISSPMGGAETTFPFHSGGPITSHQTSPAANIPITYKGVTVGNLEVCPYVDPKAGRSGVNVNVTTPLGGGGVEISTNGSDVYQSTSISGPQLNIPIAPGVNVYVQYSY